MLNNTAETIQDTSCNPFDFINEIISDTTLSGGARRVFIRIITASGYKGFCYPGIPCLCRWTGLGATQLRVYLRELVAKCHITIIHRRGRSNIYQLTRFINETTEPLQYVRTQKRFIKRKRIKSTENVVSFKPPEQPKSEPPEVAQGNNDLEQKIREGGNTLAAEPRGGKSKQVDNPRVQPQQRKVIPHWLIAQIITLTHDKRSFPLWFKLVKLVEEERILECISMLKQSLNDYANPVQNRGAYFVSILKCHCPELFQEERKHYQPPPKPAEPIVERNEALNMEGLANIKAILFGKKSPEVPDANRLNRSRNTRSLEFCNTKHAEKDKIAEN